MNLTAISLPDLIGFLLSFTFTLLVFTYIFGDNPMFRWTINLFIGVATGYAGAVAFYSVIFPRLVLPFVSGNRGEQILTVIPLFLSGLLLTKISPRLARWGNLPMAYLVGAGAAAAIGGAVLGTLFHQITASINLFDRHTAPMSWVNLLNAIIVLVGVISTLAYFHFGARGRSHRQSWQPSLTGLPSSERPSWLESLGQVGQIFVAITFGVLFAGVYAAALVALIERLSSLVNFLKPLLESFTKLP